MFHVFHSHWGQSDWIRNMIEEKQKQIQHPVHTLKVYITWFNFPKAAAFFNSHVEINGILILPPAPLKENLACNVPTPNSRILLRLGKSPQTTPITSLCKAIVDRYSRTAGSN